MMRTASFARNCNDGNHLKFIVQFFLNGQCFLCEQFTPKKHTLMYVQLIRRNKKLLGALLCEINALDAIINCNENVINSTISKNAIDTIATEKILLNPKI